MISFDAFLLDARGLCPAATRFAYALGFEGGPAETPPDDVRAKLTALVGRLPVGTGNARARAIYLATVATVAVALVADHCGRHDVASALDRLPYPSTDVATKAAWLCYAACSHEQVGTDPDRRRLAECLRHVHAAYQHVALPEPGSPRRAAAAAGHAFRVAGLVVGHAWSRGVEALAAATDPDEAVDP